ncbi:outer membrane beta-barrel protein [candidate division KSB1 bacterium]|nr:outer membrane beta-barrel protein [candidate division KSB1 bacterium]
MISKKVTYLALSLLLAVFVFQATEACAQALHATTIKLGMLNPKDAKSGFVIGATYNIIIDETLDLGLGLDVYRKTYREEQMVATKEYEMGINETTKQLEMEFSSLILPLMANINVKMPISEYTPAFVYVNGALGWQMMWNTENNYGEDKKESRFYSGFGWMAGVGLMYQVGRRSAIIAEVGYNGCKVSRNRTENTEGLPVWDEINISGLMLRAGIRMGIM